MNAKRRKSFEKFLQKKLRVWWPILLLATIFIIAVITNSIREQSEFDYPAYWGKLELASSEGITETYYAENQDIALVLRHRPTNKVVFVRNVSEVEYISESAETFSRDVASADQTLNILESGKEVMIFEPEQKYGRMLDFGYSPSGRYITFIMASTGQFDAKIFDLVNKKDILGPISSKVGISPAGLNDRQVTWSEDENILAINYYDFEVGPPHLLVSDFGNPAEMNVVMSREALRPPLSNKLTFPFREELTIKNVAITSPDIVQFNVEVCDNCYSDERKQILRSVQYHYHVRTKKLEQVE
ncbi:MAG: hypothetical protein O3A36_04035 [bacterium]|nr:hypothetical protein [bacterium]